MKISNISPTKRGVLYHGGRTFKVRIRDGSLQMPLFLKYDTLMS